MYSSAELCGNAELLRRFLSASGEPAVRHSLNSERTAANPSEVPRVPQRYESGSDSAPQASDSGDLLLDAGACKLSDLWQHRTALEGWHQRPLSAAARSSSLHQPMPMRPAPAGAPYAMHAAQQAAGGPLRLAGPAALADLTNRQRVLDPSEPEEDYGSDEGDDEAMESGFRAMDVDFLGVGRLSCEGMSSQFSASLAEGAADRGISDAGTPSGSQSPHAASWPALMPRQAPPPAQGWCAVDGEVLLHVPRRARRAACGNILRNTIQHAITRLHRRPIC